MTQFLKTNTKIFRVWVIALFFAVFRFMVSYGIRLYFEYFWVLVFNQIFSHFPKIVYNRTKTIRVWVIALFLCFSIFWFQLLFAYVLVIFHFCCLMKFCLMNAHFTRNVARPPFGDRLSPGTSLGIDYPREPLWG